MRKIVIDMQNYLFADAVATAFKNSDYDIEVIRAESPRDTVELCQVYAVRPRNGGDGVYAVEAQ